MNLSTFIELAVEGIAILNVCDGSRNLWNYSFEVLDNIANMLSSFIIHPGEKECKHMLGSPTLFESGNVNNFIVNAIYQM